MGFLKIFRSIPPFEDAAEIEKLLADPQTRLQAIRLINESLGEFYSGPLISSSRQVKLLPGAKSTIQRGYQLKQDTEKFLYEIKEASRRSMAELSSLISMLKVIDSSARTPEHMQGLPNKIYKSFEMFIVSSPLPKQSHRLSHVSGLTAIRYRQDILIWTQEILKQSLREQLARVEEMQLELIGIIARGLVTQALFKRDFQSRLQHITLTDIIKLVQTSQFWDITCEPIPPDAYAPPIVQFWHTLSEDVKLNIRTQLIQALHNSTGQARKEKKYLLTEVLPYVATVLQQMMEYQPGPHEEEAAEYARQRRQDIKKLMSLSLSHQKTLKEAKDEERLQAKTRPFITIATHNPALALDYLTQAHNDLLMPGTSAYGKSGYIFNLLTSANFGKSSQVKEMVDERFWVLAMEEQLLISSSKADTRSKEVSKTLRDLAQERFMLAQIRRKLAGTSQIAA